MDRWIEQFVECLAAADAQGVKAEEAMALKDRNLPSRVYKYRKNNNYALEGLEADTVWLSSPGAYNDPYDCSIRISEDRFMAGLEKNLIDSFLELFKDRTTLGSDEVNAAKESPYPLRTAAALIAKSLDDPSTGDPLQLAEVTRKIFSMFFNEWIASIGGAHKETLKVCSFSSVKDSIIMWGHYSENHKGFCLEYDISQLPPSELSRRLLFPVIYSEKLFDATRYFQRMIVAPDISTSFFQLWQQYINRPNGNTRKSGGSYSLET
jgi:hypothetical protein